MIEGKDQFEVIEAMGVRTVDEILAKTVELEQTQKYLLDLIDTKTKVWRFGANRKLPILTIYFYAINRIPYFW